MSDMDDQLDQNHNSHKKREYLKSDANPAADMIRQKLNTLYKTEPDAVEEAAEVAAIPKRSKHQQFMYELSNSGKPLAVVQTEWHTYYTALSDHEKHEVWKEFYAANDQQATAFQTASKPAESPVPGAAPAPAVLPAAEPIHTVAPAQRNQTRSVADIKKQITSKVRVRGKLSRKQHLQSLGLPA